MKKKKTHNLSQTKTGDERPVSLSRPAAGLIHDIMNMDRTGRYIWLDDMSEAICRAVAHPKFNNTVQVFKCLETMLTNSYRDCRGYPTGQAYTDPEDMRKTLDIYLGTDSGNSHVFDEIWKTASMLNVMSKYRKYLMDFSYDTCIFRVHPSKYMDLLPYVQTIDRYFNNRGRSADDADYSLRQIKRLVMQSISLFSREKIEETLTLISVLDDNFFNGRFRDVLWCRYDFSSVPQVNLSLLTFALDRIKEYAEKRDDDSCILAQDWADNLSEIMTVEMDKTAVKN